MKKHVLGPWSVEDFISGCWQKAPLLIPAALPELRGLIAKKHLLALACQIDVDARLITTDNKQKDWQCEQGPFKVKQFKSLANAHWTLLVQAVDQHLPDVAALLQHFDFLPSWRLDDIMVSYATAGGGVGPHFDYYDVFLLQASGTRRWQIGQHCDHRSALRDHPDMKLLKQFKQEASYDVAAGDMLYIPAGVAHWGTATSDDCITVSIGFRAASQRELIQIAIDKIASTLPESERYRDSRAAMDKDPFCINPYAVNQVQQFWKNIDSLQIKEALAQALGEYSTEPRYPDQVFSDHTVKTVSVKKLSSLKHNKASRFSYRALDKTKAELYVDGETHYTSLAMAKAICHLQFSPTLLAKDTNKNLLLKLINQGSVCD